MQALYQGPKSRRIALAIDPLPSKDSYLKPLGPKTLSYQPFGGHFDAKDMFWEESGDDENDEDKFCHELLLVLQLL